MNLKSELHQLSLHGFKWYGLRHLDRSKPCSCISTEGKGNPLCTRCSNTGYLFTDYLVHAYTWPSIFGVSFTTQAGAVSTQTRNVAFRHDVLVGKGDLLLELKTDEDTGQPVQPFSIVRAFEVQDISRMVGFGGRTEFVKSVIEEKSFSDGTVGELGAERTLRVSK